MFDEKIEDLFQSVEDEDLRLEGIEDMIKYVNVIKD